MEKIFSMTVRSPNALPPHLQVLQIPPLYNSFARKHNFGGTGAPCGGGPNQRVRFSARGTTEATQACREAAAECLNIVTASASCKEITTQSCFRFSDVSATWFLLGPVCLYRGKEKRVGASTDPAERISRCLSVLWMCCSCVVSKAHFLSVPIGLAVLRLVSITPKHVASATLTDASLTHVVLNFPR